MSVDAALELIVPTAELGNVFRAIGKLGARKDQPPKKRLSIKMPDGTKVMVPIAAVHAEPPFFIRVGEHNPTFYTPLWCRYDKSLAAYCKRYDLQYAIETQGRSKFVEINGFDISCYCYADYSLVSFLATRNQLGMALLSPETNAIRHCFRPVLEAAGGMLALLSAEGTYQLLDSDFDLGDLIGVQFEDFFDSGSFDRERWIAAVLKDGLKTVETARSPIGECCFIERWGIAPDDPQAGVFSAERFRLWQTALRLGLETSTFGDCEQSIVAKVPAGQSEWEHARAVAIARTAKWISEDTQDESLSGKNFMTAMSAALDGDQAELEALRKQAQAADEQLMKHALAIAPEVEALFPRLFEGGVPQWDWDNIMPLADLEALPEHMLSADRLRLVDKHLRERDLQWTTAREAALQVARSGRVGQAAFMLQATLTEVMNVSGHEERGDWPEPDAEQWFATLKRLQKPLADYFAERTAAACNQKDWVHACDAILWWLDVEPVAGKFWNDAVARTCVREMDRIRAGVANAKKSAEKSKSRDPSGVVWAALLEWRFSPRWW